MPIMPRDKRSAPGFNMDSGSESMPSGPEASQSPSNGTVGQSRPPRAADLMAAAEGELNPPRPPKAEKAPKSASQNTGGQRQRAQPPSDPVETHPWAQPGAQRWQRNAHQLLTGGTGDIGEGGRVAGGLNKLNEKGYLPNGTGGSGNALSRLGPLGAGADMAWRGAKSMVAPNPHQNPDSWRAANSSDEGQSLWMGRGTDRPGLYGIQTQKRYLQPPSGGRSGYSQANMFPSEYKETYPDHDSGDHVGSTYSNAPVTPGSTAPQQGLAPPGPASDYMHQSKTTGTGGPWFDAHTEATSGLNAPTAQSIRGLQNE